MTLVFAMRKITLECKGYNLDVQSNEQKKNMSWTFCTCVNRSHHVLCSTFIAHSTLANTTFLIVYPSFSLWKQLKRLDEWPLRNAWSLLVENVPVKEQVWVENICNITDTSWPESQLTNDKWVGFGQLFMAIRTLVTCMVEIKSSW